MSSTKVRDVMTREVITVPPGAPLREVAQLMAENGISGVPVVDASANLIGVISEGDFLVKERGRPPRWWRASTCMAERSAQPRPVERWLGVYEGQVRCPRTQTQEPDCRGCQFLARIDTPTSSVVCTYPIPARETFARRATHDQAARIALGHRLERT
jgi:hypothetical protein